MYRIVRRESFGPATFLWEVEAPRVARVAQPGHFLMVRIDEHGERIPLTVADYDRQRGTVTVVIQAVGKRPMRLARSSRKKRARTSVTRPKRTITPDRWRLAAGSA